MSDSLCETTLRGFHRRRTPSRTPVPATSAIVRRALPLLALALGTFSIGTR